MNQSAKIAIGAGITALMAVAVIVFAFTNIGDLTSKEMAEFTSKIEVTNPIQPYKINTDCELVEFYNESENLYNTLDLILANPDLVELKYFEKGGNKQDLARSHVLIQEISAEIIAEEYSINPALIPIVIDILGQQSTLEFKDKLKSLGSNCNTWELSEHKNSNIYTVYAKNPMKPTLQDGDDVIVDKNIQLTDLKEGDIIVYKSNLEYNPFRFSRVIVADPDSGNISTKLDMQRYPIHHDYPNGKNEFIGKVTKIIRDGKEISLPLYVPYNTDEPRNAAALGSEHSHAALLVKIFGDTFEFSSPSFQIKSSWINFERMDGSTIHKHATGVNLGYLFDTIGIGLDDQCYVFPDGKSFCTNDDYTLKFFINREQVSDIRDYEIMEGDRILVVFGSETPEEIEAYLIQLDNQELIK